jgi:hypothetical protein
MEQRITSLQHEFNNISLIRNKIMNIFDLLKNKMDKLKLLYSDFIKNSKSQLFVFGLDSFHFQSKLIDLEYDDMKRMFLAINNRMYCEYFKLYKIIVSYITENINDKKIMEIIKGNNFPIYKDLEPFKDYTFEIILEIHEIILSLLNSIISFINNRENELSLHKSKQLIGLNIDNFVNSFNFEIIIMKEKINLFLTYIEFFHKLHAKYLNRFVNKIHLTLTHINSDIHFDDSIENNLDVEIKYELKEIPKKYDDNINDNKKDLNLNISLVEENNIENEYYLHLSNQPNTPSDYSYKSNHSSNNSNFRLPNIPKAIKKGLKKVSDVLNGCNNIKQIENDNISTKENIDLIYFDELYKENENNILILKDNSFYNISNINNIDEQIKNEILNETKDEIINETIITDNINGDNYQEITNNNLDTEVNIEVNSNEFKSVSSELSEISTIDTVSTKEFLLQENTIEEIKINEQVKKRRKYKPRNKKIN